MRAGRGGVLPARRARSRRSPLAEIARAHAGRVGRLPRPALAALREGEEARSRSPTPSSRCGAAASAAPSPTSWRSRPTSRPRRRSCCPRCREEGRICLEWLAAARRTCSAGPVEVGGYEVYRRILPQEEYEPPLNAEAGRRARPTWTRRRRTARPSSTRCAPSLAKNPKVEGLPAEELAFIYRDVYPPPAPSRLDALSEGNLVRLRLGSRGRAGPGGIPRVPRRGRRRPRCA